MVKASLIETSTADIHHTPVTKADSSKAGFAGVTKAVSDKLARLGITRELDLVLHLPLRYDDET